MVDGFMECKECFFFDAGNTIIRLSPSREELLMGILDERGIGVTLGQIKVGFMLNDREFNIGGFTLLSQEDRERFWVEYTRGLLESIGIEMENPDGLSSSVAGAFNSPESWEEFPDVRPTLENLIDSGCTLAVISNAEFFLKDTLNRLDLSKYFETIVMSEEIGVEKPDPRIFKIALDRVGMSAERCVHVGDLIETDVKGAMSCGITPVWLDRQRLGKKVPGILRIDTLRDLPVMFALPADGRS